MSSATLIDMQQEQNIGIGDVVALRSGGPRMTVTYVGPVGFASGDWLVCQWFDEQGELRQDMFAQDRVRLEPRSIPPGSVQMQQYFGIATVGRL
ncbi:YodC family protein [Paraburkholderia kururiensis]|uniref:YodC family protein n=1 Tax=Paraburkholderia kururiensis TaxID=984307 RepID=A0ABZ0WQG0_9BURK|nr:YodC family protein [Paraburkholderia kururiensis]WQD79613.1 YodC family protein [Paraburkholderia kururiensis]